MPSRRAGPKVNYSQYQAADDLEIGSGGFADDSDEFELGGDEMDVEAESEAFEEIASEHSGESSPASESEELSPQRGSKRATRPVSRKGGRKSELIAGSAPLSERVPKKPAQLKLPSVEPPKFTRERQAESLRERSELFFGAGEKDLVNAVDARISWSSSPFFPDPAILKASKVPRAAERPRSGWAFVPPRTGDSPCDPGDGAAASNLIIDNTLLRPGQVRATNDIKHLNIGYPVSTLQWAPFREQEQLLAVAVLDDSTESPVNASTVRRELAVAERASTTTTIFIYSFDFETQSLLLAYSLVSERGPVKQLSWRPVNESRELCLVFQDGTAQLVLCPDVWGAYSLAKAPVLEVAGRDKATCCTWRTADALVLGTLNGYLVEYDASDTEAWNSPSYAFPVFPTVIVDIVSAYPSHSSIVFASSVDGFCKVIDIENIQKLQGPTPRIKSFAKDIAWCPLMQSFVSLEDELTTKLVPIRRPGLVQSGTNLTRHDSTVTAVAASPFHPFVLSGGLDGQVHIANAMRRSLVSKRNAKNHQDCTLWALECSERSSTYRVIESLEVRELATHKFVNKITLYPKSCTITALTWLHSGSAAWYAAGTASGLVRIQNLGA